MNIVYIRYAIFEKTGVWLKLKEVVSYLTEEGLITTKQARNIIFPGFSRFYPKDNNWHKLPVTVLAVDEVLSNDRQTAFGEATAFPDSVSQ